MRLLFSQEVFTVSDIAAANDEDCFDTSSNGPGSYISTWWPLFFRTGFGSFARTRPQSTLSCAANSLPVESGNAPGKAVGTLAEANEEPAVVEKLTQPDAQFSLALNALETIVKRATAETAIPPVIKGR